MPGRSIAGWKNTFQSFSILLASNTAHGTCHHLFGVLVSCNDYINHAPGCKLKFTVKSRSYCRFQPPYNQYRITERTSPCYCINNKIAIQTGNCTGSSTFTNTDAPINGSLVLASLITCFYLGEKPHCKSIIMMDKPAFKLCRTISVRVCFYHTNWVLKNYIKWFSF